jgi:hypothetical protein
MKRLKNSLTKELPIQVPGSDHFSIAKPADKAAIQHRLLGRFILESALSPGLEPPEPAPLSSVPPPQKPAFSSSGKIASASGALAVWQEKLSFLLVEEAKTADPAQKFSLGKSIEEARAKIREHGGQA